jgi:hypothetical protein
LVVILGEASLKFIIVVLLHKIMLVVVSNPISTREYTIIYKTTELKRQDRKNTNLMVFEKINEDLMNEDIIRIIHSLPECVFTKAGIGQRC